MPTLDFETAIADFLSLGRRLQARQPLIGENILAELTTWYRDTRVLGTSLDKGDDMLLLQWGGTYPLVVSEPTDLRFRADDELEWTEQRLQYLDFTRQVFVSSRKREFDATAVHMSMTLGYDPVTGEEPESNLWIRTPDEVESGVGSIAEVPYVKSLLHRTALVVSITVGRCG